MRVPKLKCFFAALGLAMAGCDLAVQAGVPDGGVGLTALDACTKVPALVEEAQRKLGECTQRLTAGERIPELTVANCERRLPSCTTVDREQLDLYLACLRQLPTCTLSTLTTFRAGANLCAARLAYVSRICTGALAAYP